MNAFVAATLKTGKLEIIVFADETMIDDSMADRDDVETWRQVKQSDLPSDRSARDAWTDTGTKIKVDPDKVKETPFTVYKADIWRRATDQEADAIAAGLAQQTTRLQMIFRDADHLQSDDPLFTGLQTQFVAVFGKKRANELLAAS